MSQPDILWGNQTFYEATRHYLSQAHNPWGNHTFYEPGRYFTSQLFKRCQAFLTKLSLCLTMPQMQCNDIETIYIMLKPGRQPGGLESGVWGLGTGDWGLSSGIWGLWTGIWGLQPGHGLLQPGRQAPGVRREHEHVNLSGRPGISGVNV